MASLALGVREPMTPDHAKRMLIEANKKIIDAEILAESPSAQSDAQALISIMGFEILLKCAIKISGQEPSSTHNYQKLWMALPGYAQKHVLKLAQDRMAGHTDFSDLPKVLGWFQTVYEKGRYFYEFYEGYTIEEQRELGEFWVEVSRGQDT